MRIYQNNTEDIIFNKIYRFDEEEDDGWGKKRKPRGGGKGGGKRGEELIQEDITVGTLPVENIPAPVVEEESNKEEIKEDSEEKGVWYEGIEDDLRWLTYFDGEFRLDGKSTKDDMSPEEKRVLADRIYGIRLSVSEKMIKKKINLPKLSVNPRDIEAFNARKILRDACKYLWDRKYVTEDNNNWRTENEAFDYLRGLGINVPEGEIIEDKKVVKEKSKVVIENYGGIDLSFGDPIIKKLLEEKLINGSVDIEKWEATEIELRDYWGENNTSMEEQEWFVRKLSQLCRILLNPLLKDPVYDKTGEFKKFSEDENNIMLMKAFGVKML